MLAVSSMTVWNGTPASSNSMNASCFESGLHQNAGQRRLKISSIIDPVGMPVAQVVAAAGGQTVLALARDVDGVQVEIAHECDRLAVGTELGKLLAAGLIGQANRRGQSNVA